MAKYKYLDLTPSGASINDCVTRAIEYATGLPYDVIVDKLYLTSELLDCERLCVSCYEFLLTNVFGFIPIVCNGLTLNEFADIHPRGLYLVRSNGHISVLDNFVVRDEFDCRNMVLTNAWKVE